MLTATGEAIAHSEAFQKVGEELAACVRYLSVKGWTPATSSNFSARVPGVADAVAMSRTGVDKAFFTAADLLVVDREGRTAWPEGARASAETPLHLAIYDLFDPQAVLHTHSVNATALSIKYAEEGSIRFGGLELLKGFTGITTHDTSLEVPIFPNDQEMVRFANMARGALRGQKLYGFLIAGHGLYTWGQSVGEARRHLEVFEFLFELQFRMEVLNGHTAGA